MFRRASNRVERIHRQCRIRPTGSVSTLSDILSLVKEAGWKVGISAVTFTIRCEFEFHPTKMERKLSFEIFVEPSTMSSHAPFPRINETEILEADVPKKTEYENIYLFISI